MRMLIFFLSIILGICLILSTSPADAQLAFGTPDIYQVTIIKFEISSNNGGSYTEIGSGGLIFNIAAANAGTQVGTYFSGGSPLSPSTTYNRMKVTINCTFQLRGCVNTVCTRAGTDQPGGDAPAVEGSYTIPVAQVPDCADGQATFESPEGQISCTTEADGGLQSTMKFDVTNGLALFALPNTLGPGSPTVTFTCP